VSPFTSASLLFFIHLIIALHFFRTVFEVTTRYVDLQPVGMGAFGLVCSAKDQLTATSVAIKKIMKPFSTPVLSKRTYRELKLLKHIRHENVSVQEASGVVLLACASPCWQSSHTSTSPLVRSFRCRTFSSHHSKTCGFDRDRAESEVSQLTPALTLYSYFVTELLGTDLHRLLTSRPLEKQFIQYFLYQILRGLKYVHSAGVVHRDLVRRLSGEGGE
jgi:p38 MAP kinase